MNAIASDMLTEQPMNEAVKRSLAQRIDEIIRHAVVDVVQEAREEGWRAGYAAGRIDVRREMNVRLRALILDEDDSGFVPQPGDAQADEAVSLVDIFDQMSSGTRDTTAGVAGAAALARPPTEAGSIAPAKAAEEEADGEAGAATTASSCDAAAPQPIGRPPNTGGEPPALSEPPVITTAAATKAAAPAGPGAELGIEPPSPSPQPLSTSAAALPAPPAKAPAPKPIWPGDWRTEDRKKVFVELYESGTDMTEIRLALADIAGPRVPNTNAALWAWVTALKIRRNAHAAAAEPQQQQNPDVAGDRRGPQQDTAAPQPPSRPPAIHPSIAPPGPRPDGTNPKAKVIDLPPPAPNGKIYTSFYNIRAWAGVYGITYDGTNIDKVNKLRTAKSMPPLVQEG